MLSKKPANRNPREGDPVAGEFQTGVVKGQGACPSPLRINLVRVLRVP